MEIYQLERGYNIKGGAICMNPNMKDIYLERENLFQFIKV